LERYENMER
jgi:hypothetical protein